MTKTLITVGGLFFIGAIAGFIAGLLSDFPTATTLSLMCFAPLGWTLMVFGLGRFTVGYRLQRVETSNYVGTTASDGLVQQRRQHRTLTN